MTLIAGVWSNDSQPVLVGDLLLSGSGDSGHSIGLPSFTDAESVFGESEWTIKGLRQKLTLLSDRCAIGWAGSYIHAKAFIQDMAKLESDSRITQQIIQTYISENQSDLQAVSLIVYLLEGGQLKVYQHDCVVTNHGQTTTAIAGSAVSRFTDTIKQTSQGPLPSASVAARSSSLQAALAALAPYLAAEFYDDFTLLEGFGGGYEIVTSENERLQKLDHLAFVIWGGEFNETSGRLRLPPPRAIAVQDYIDGYLLIRSFLLTADPNEPEPIKVDKGALHIVRPMVNADRSIEDLKAAAILKPVMPKLVCNILLISDSSEGGGCIVDFSTAGDAAKRSIRFTGVNLEFFLNGSYAEEVESWLRNQRRSHT